MKIRRLDKNEPHAYKHSAPCPVYWFTKLQSVLGSIFAASFDSLWPNLQLAMQEWMPPVHTYAHCWSIKFCWSTISKHSKTGFCIYSFRVQVLHNPLIEPTVFSWCFLKDPIRLKNFSELLESVYSGSKNWTWSALHWGMFSSTRLVFSFNLTFLDFPVWLKCVCFKNLFMQMIFNCICPVIILI